MAAHIGSRGCRGSSREGGGPLPTHLTLCRTEASLGSQCSSCVISLLACLLVSIWFHIEAV